MPHAKSGFYLLAEDHKLMLWALDQSFKKNDDPRTHLSWQSVKGLLQKGWERCLIYTYPSLSIVFPPCQCPCLWEGRYLL